MSRPLYEPTAEAAAKIAGHHYGFVGKVGGWIYGPSGRPFCQGWAEFGKRTGAVVRKDVVDPRRPGETVRRYAIDWKALADYAAPRGWGSA